jgi:translation initiation factor 1
MTKQNNRLVFSTRSGDQRKLPEASLAPARSLPPPQQNLKVMRDKKGRKGKVVTVITDFVLTEADLRALAKELKNMCGAGGTAKIEPAGLSIEVQGDHREKVADKLKALGYKVKLAGG